MNNRYFLLRHGKTEYQKKKRGFIYPKKEKEPILLVKEGIKEIKEAAEKLKKRGGVDLIFSSPLPRTRQTAGIIAEILGVDKVYFSQKIKEVDVGVYAGKTKKELNNDYPETIKRFKLPLPGGENWNNLKDRMYSFLTSLEKKYKNKKILIVSHGDPIWMLLGKVKNLSNKKILEEKRKLYPKPGKLIEIK